jgi:hypothetical protein
MLKAGCKMVEQHVETKRLFFAASGEIVLSAEEEWHRHACDECRELYRIFSRLNSLQGTRPDQGPRTAQRRQVG